VVNKAGHGFAGAVEEADDAEVANLYETNVFGLFRVPAPSCPIYSTTSSRRSAANWKPEATSPWGRISKIDTVGSIMRKTVPPPSKRQGRPRSAEAESAVLKAARELLNKKPLREVTADAIAQRAGVSKATIYKWWPNKNHVALDAFLSQMQLEVTTPDTGSALQDFTQQVKSVIAFYTSPRGRLFRQFIAEGQSDRSFLALFNERFLKLRRDAVRVIWQRGVDRGELRSDVDCDAALDLIYGRSLYRLMTEHAPVNDAQAEALVALAFRGLEKPSGRA
jgi:AcrR family transcriptional regulator